MEPIAPDQWAADAGHPLFGEPPLGTGSGNRWNKYATSRSCFFNGKLREARPCPVVKLEDYERTTAPAAHRVLRATAGSAGSSRGSTQYGRAYADPEEVPGRDRATTTSCASAGRGRSTVARTASRAGAVLVRLLVQLLPARVRPARARRSPIYQLRALRDCERMKRVVAIAAGFVVVALGGPNLIVWLGGRGRHAATRSEVPHAQAALVLGAQVMPNGAPSSMLSDRITAAAELYEAGKVDKLLLSGDHGRVAYDEVGTMKRILLARGIPARGHLHRPRGLRHVGLRAARQARLRRGLGDGRHPAFHMARAL